MKKLCSLLAIFLLPMVTSFAQPTFTWAKHMGGTGADNGNSIAMDTSGNVYITGTFLNVATMGPYTLTSAGSSDIFVSKLDPSGNFIWVKSMGGTSIDIAYSIAVDDSGNVYTTGNIYGTTNFNPGGIYNLTSAGGADIFVSKLNTSGNFVWAKRMGGTGADVGNSIAVDDNGNVYTTGYFYNTADFDPGGLTYNLTSAGNADIFVSKLDKSGNFVWAKRMGSSAPFLLERACSIAVDGSGNVYTTGTYGTTVDFDPDPAAASIFNLTSVGAYDIFVSKLNTAGNFVWAKSMGGSGPTTDIAYSIAVDGSGNVYTTGGFAGTADFNPGGAVNNRTSVGLDDFFVSKLDVSGNFLWALNAGGAKGEYGHSIVLDGNGSFYIMGDQYSITANYNPSGTFNLINSGNEANFIARYDLNGNFLCAMGLSPGSLLLDNETSCDHHIVAKGNKIWATANFTDAATDFDPCTAFYNPGFYGGNTDIYLASYDFTNCNCTAAITCSVTLSPSTTICMGQNTTLSASGGGFYLWSEGSTTSSVTVSPTINTVYTVTMSNGVCTATASTTVIVNPLPGVVTTQINVNCNGFNTGAATALATGGTAGYKYFWSNSKSTFSVTGLSASIYTLTITDAAGCTATTTLTITSPPAIAVSVISSTVACTASNGFASATTSGGTPGYMYLWNTIPAQSTALATGLSAGTYILTITDTLGCIKNAIATINNVPSASINSTQVNVSCNGAADGYAVVTATGGTFGYSYSWNPGGYTTPSATGLNANTYYITVTDGGGCISIHSLTITAPGPINLVVSSASITCYGNANGTAMASASGGISSYNYSWSNGINLASITNLTVGNYTIVVTDANGCTASASATISEPAALNITASSTSLTCNGDNSGAAIANASGGTIPYNYSWSNGSNISNISNLTSQIYSVTVTDNNGCITTTSVSINQPPLITISVTTTDENCNKSDGAASVSASGGTGAYTYLWSNLEITSTITHLTSAIYSVTVTDSNGCTKTQLVSVAQQNNNLNLAVSSTDAGCTVSKGIATTTVSGGNAPYKYSWSQAGATGAMLTGLAQGTYSVIITDNDGCTQSKTVTIGTTPNPTAVAENSATIVYPNSVILSASGGVTYYWSPSAGLSCTTCANPTANPLATTIYCVEVTDTNGCTAKDCVTITLEIICRDIYIPTAFSPNGDNENDEFEVITENKCVKKFHIIIFNRWGEKVFETADIREEWNGFYKRKEINTSILAYYLEAELVSGELIIRKGNISLIR